MIQPTAKCVKKIIGSTVLGTRWYNFQPPTLSLSSIKHHKTVDRCHYEANCRSLCATVRLAKKLKIEHITLSRYCQQCFVIFLSWCLWAVRKRRPGCECSSVEPSSVNSWRSLSNYRRISGPNWPWMDGSWSSVGDSIQCQFWWEGNFRIDVALWLYGSVFQPFLWNGTLCSNFDCSRNPWA